MPIDRAVPSMVRTADSTVAQFMSSHLLLGQLRDLLHGHLADLVLVRLLRPAPGFFVVASPAAFFRSTLAGGVLRMKLNERSA